LPKHHRHYNLMSSTPSGCIAFDVSFRLTESILQLKGSSLGFHHGSVWICFFLDYGQRNARIRKNHVKRFASQSLLRAVALYRCRVLYCIGRIKKRGKNHDSHVCRSAPTRIAAKHIQTGPIYVFSFLRHVLEIDAMLSS
jgi:hypothetical protein